MGAIVDFEVSFRVTSSGTGSPLPSPRPQLQAGVDRRGNACMHDASHRFEIISVPIRIQRTTCILFEQNLDQANAGREGEQRTF